MNSQCETVKLRIFDFLCFVHDIQAPNVQLRRVLSNWWTTPNDKFQSDFTFFCILSVHCHRL